MAIDEYFQKKIWVEGQEEMVDDAAEFVP